MNVNQVMENFTDFLNSAKLEQAERLIRKHSRNKENELAQNLLSLGVNYGNAKIYDLAIFCFELSQKISRNLQIRKIAKHNIAESHNQLGVYFVKVGLFDQAEFKYKRAIHLNPHFSQVHNNYAILLKKLERFGEAQQEYEVALKIKPGDHEVHHNYALLLIASGKIEEAEEHLRKSLMNPDYFQAKITYSVLLMGKSKFSKAEDLLCPLLKICPEEPVLLGNLGIISFAQGDFSKTIKYFKQAQDSFKRQGKIRYSIAAEGYLDWVQGTRSWASDDLDTSSQLFESASDKFYHAGFEEQSLVLFLLSLLLPFDRDLVVALQSKSLIELREYIAELYRKMYIFENIQSPKLPHFKILVNKFECIKILYCALKFENYDIRKLEEAKRVFLQFNFNKVLQSVDSLHDFVQELHCYESLEEIPYEKEQQLLRIIQSFNVLNGVVTRELSMRAQSDVNSLIFLLEEKIDLMEDRILRKIDESTGEIVEEVQYSRDEIINLLEIRYGGVIDNLAKLNKQQLIRFQEMIEKAIQSKIDSIENTEKRRKTKMRWNQLRRLTSVTVNAVGFIASIIQIYLFMNDGQVGLAFDQVQTLLDNLVDKIT
jgi:Tfp pilus assembly protein PilF